MKRSSFLARGSFPLASLRCRIVSRFTILSALLLTMRPSGQYGYPIRRQGSSPTTWGRDTPSDQSPDGRLSTRMAQMSLSAGPLERPSRPASYSPPRVSPPVTFTWEKVRTTGEVFTPRTGHCCASVGDRIFLFGGTDGESRKCDVYCYWCTRQEWEKIQVQRSHDGQLSEPAARSGARSVVYEGIVYIFGGYTKKDGDYFNDTWAFNPLYHTWTVLAAAGDVPARRTDHSMVLYDGSIYVFGGFDGRNRYNDVYSMELPPHGAFREGSPIARWQLEDGPVIRRSSGQECPSPRFGHSAVVYGSCMYVFGGWDGHDTLNELWEFNFPSGRWYPVSQRGVVPRSRYRHGCVVIDDSMIVFGGVDKDQTRFNELAEFNFKSGVWSKLDATGEIPTGRTFHKCRVWDGTLYVIGGFDGRRQNDMYRVPLEEGLRKRAEINRPDVSLRDATGDQCQAEACHCGDTSSCCEPTPVVMPEDLCKWQKVETKNSGANDLSGRTGHAAVVWGKYLFVFGGTDEHARQNDVYKFDFSTQMWSRVATSSPQPAARSGSKAVVYKDYMYLFGGYTKKEGEYFNDMWKLNLAQGTWALVKPRRGTPPSPRTDHTCCILRSDIYVFGGFDGRSRFQDLHIFNTEEESWTAISPGNEPLGRFGHTAVMYNTSMYVFGGWNGHDTLDDLCEYSTESQNWLSVPGRGEIVSSRYRHSAVVYGCCMFVFGGVDKKQERFSDLCEFNFETRAWSRVKTWGDPATPSARTFHQAVMYKGFMYIVGGFDGFRRNDIWCIPLVEEVSRAEKGRRKRLTMGRVTSRTPLRELNDDAGDNNDWTGSDEQPDQGTAMPAGGGDVKVESKEMQENVRLRARVSELEERLASMEEEDLCKICFDRTIDTVLLDCAHRVVCHGCTEQLSTCPVCRSPIRKVIITYDG